MVALAAKPATPPEMGADEAFAWLMHNNGSVRRSVRRGSLWIVVRLKSADDRIVTIRERVPEGVLDSRQAATDAINVARGAVDAFPIPF